MNLQDTFNTLIDQESETRSLFMNLDPQRRHFCSVHSTEDRIIFINQTKEEDIIDTEKVQLVKIEPIRSNSGHIYFVEKELNTQNSFIVQLVVTFNERYKQWEYAKKRVYRLMTDV